jgi:copper chaperone
MSVTQRFKVNGMKCGGCVAKATQALTGLTGFEGVDIDLANGVAAVRGNVDPTAVVKALTDAGYPATPSPG